ncbi:hypothetical protein SAMN05216360_12512 [Methylobacterium phyllostachyos]|uniref:Uncharacterized protein n=1 Tax=Methylobacterium phyllostachyos TaxID=582672 RepID=A0A1H0K611_9HYPH|nr:hypothetical protein [Methylobacterium phyllostachyos]SDO51319.1 hypothetical protein SAMN05216360_12512 [Methylobacterium phyllostachyos]
MPTALPIRSQHAAAVEHLSWPDTARFLILLVRVRWLNRRLEVAHARVERYGLDDAGPALLLTARRWLDAHEAMGALLRTPELPEVGELRAMMRPPIGQTVEDRTL